MMRFFSQVARAIARAFTPEASDLVAVGFQPITSDVYRCNGSTCYASDMEEVV